MQVTTKKRLLEIGLVAGVGLIIAGFMGCRAMGIAGDDPGVVNSVTGVGQAVTAAGTMSANPVLLALGTVITTAMGYLRLKAGKSPAPTV